MEYTHLYSLVTLLNTPILLEDSFAEIKTLLQSLCLIIPTYSS